MPTAIDPVLYWHTLRHLRREQVYGRLRRQVIRPRPDLSPAPAPRPRTGGTWQPCGRPPSMTGPASFRFLEVERTLSAPADWSRAGWPKLWLYNAHYFDDLAASGAPARRAWHAALISRWIAENQPGSRPGWEPYPTSLRIVNWVKWALQDGPLDERARLSLAVQARFLGKQLETHLAGNHLWANAKALVFAGVFFDGAEAAAWLDQGLALARRELAEQVLPDGGHFERSPMYHAIVLEDAIDLLQLTALFPGLLDEADIGRWREAAGRMLRWLRVMSHPDGGVAFFNDAALGIAPDLAALTAYAARVGLPIRTDPLAETEPLPDSGYVRLEAGPAVLIADAAPVGPDHIPGHAHADTLSFELSLNGRRLLVNGGTSTYEEGEQRRRERGTAMHNTVEVDGEDSSEVWAAFRVARRARPFDVRWGRDGGMLWLEASHDGYRRLRGRVTHRRRWELREPGLRIADTIEGRFTQAVARFRFAPDGPLPRWTGHGQSAGVMTPGTWHPRFGASEPCRVLEMRFAGPRQETAFTWA
jgi:uncharacterized heparinase superfamily protein